MNMGKSKFIKVIALFSLLFSSVAFSQPDGWQNKIQWSFSVEKIDDSHAFIVSKAKLIEGWHIFSVNHDPNKADLTGYPTTFKFIESKDYKLIGKFVDGTKPETHKDELGVSLYFEKSASFKQKIEILTDKMFSVNFEYSFQICDENGCLFPPDQEGKVKISGFSAKKAEVSTPPIIDDSKTDKLKTKEEALLVVEPEVNKVEKEEKQTVVEKPKKFVPNPIKKGDVNFWKIFFEGFGWGFVALLTPCVFPMIPMTVSFFTKGSGSRSKGILNALIYGISIIVIYVSLGLVITAMLGPTGLNQLSTNVWMNLIFFAVFMVFAFSFLGAFEIRMPSKWVNSADTKADKGGLIGIFFMAFTLALVSFSCTGPIIGSSLVQAASSGSIMGPAVIMAGFSTALALPFTLFAIFPGWLNSMPQSGGWLNSVKVVLGLLEIALAMKFLSMVDLAYHWNILTREIFVAMWFVIFVVMGFYLLGKLKFSHDSNVDKISVTRFMFAFLAFTFSIYLLPGMWGAPLSMIDGVAPPRTHSEDNFRFVRGSGSSSSNSVQLQDPIFSEYRKYMHEVGDGSILVFHDLEIAKEYATKVEKPILLDFTGHACANCRKTESTVWTNSEISPSLKNELVIVSLYCDDRELLPVEEQIYSDILQGKIKTVGNKWSDYQIKKYGQISQPLYVLMDSEGNDLTEAIGYTPNIKEYKSFLEKGIERFKKK